MAEQAEIEYDRELLAAEFALGLLEGDALAEARRRVLADPDFRASHAYWQTVSEQWLEEVEPASGEIDLWPAIESAIEAASAAPSRPDRADGAASRTASSWAIAATLAALVAGAATLVFYQRENAARQDSAVLAQKLAQAENERQLARIATAPNGALVSATYDPAGDTIELRISAATSQEKVPELWVIPEDGKPRSLGIFKSAKAELSIAPDLKPFLIEGATLAVTMEPAAGAPHAAPTGPVIGAAELRTH